MIKWTNKYHLPAAMVNAIKNDTYDPGDGDISCTTLVGPTMIRHLKKEHRGELEIDVADRLFSLYGQSMHEILERGSTTGDVSERRLYMKVNGWKLSGQMDLLSLDDHTLTDYKQTSIFALRGEEKPEWVAQLNVLAELCRQNGYKVGELQIVGIARDWRRTESLRYEDYPSVPVKVVPIELWSNTKIMGYIEERIAAHQGEPQCCTAEERWSRPDKYAVMKSGRKSAVRLLDSRKEAQAYIDSHTLKGTITIVKRPGEDIRCENYCDYSAMCECTK